MSTIADRVAAGVAYLDRTEPGWERRIDLEWLDITDCDRCVIGQLYPDVRDRCRSLSRYDPALGFDASGDLTSDALRKEWAKLTAEWRKVIRARVGVAS